MCLCAPAGALWAVIAGLSLSGSNQPPLPLPRHPPHFPLASAAAAAAALSDMPPRAESELDPVTLHNQALVALALGSGAGAGAGAGACASAAFDKLAHLLAHPPFPPELLGNLLSLCCRPEGSASSAGAPGLPPSGRPSAGERAALAQRLLEDPGLAPAVAAHVPADLLPLYEAMCVARAVSAEAALLRLDALAGQRVEALRKRVKAVQVSGSRV